MAARLIASRLLPKKATHNWQTPARVLCQRNVGSSRLLCSEETGVIASKEPFELELKRGKTYLWCACGRSLKQPFCDGRHRGTKLRPTKFQVEEQEDEVQLVFLCGCKQTSTRPFCDGTHATPHVLSQTVHKKTE
nr:CDGSH iron sulfur domain 3 [Halisarca dujardinii]